MMKQEYTLIRSDRKTITLQLSPEGNLTVRAPRNVSLYRIDETVQSHAGWIEKKRKALEKNRKMALVITPEIRADGLRRARKIIPARTSFFSGLMNVTYGTVSIREQKTRWGSCSGKGNLSFNWKLVLLSPELLDYVVVHELAHRVEMNHSPRFWAVVESVLPDYKSLRKRLREEGARLTDEPI